VTPRIGFVLGPEAAGLTRRSAAALEATGADSLWIGGHVVSTDPASEVVTSLAWLAAMTDRVTVGSAVLVLPLYSPVVVAKQFAELDRASGGRISMGIGSGSDPAEIAACGGTSAGRGRRVDESIEIIRSLWRGAKVTTSGPSWDLADTTIAPLPARPGGPPIIVAGRKAAAMRRAALLGDGWLPSMFSPGAYARSVEQVCGLATDAGRSLVDFDWSCLVYVRVDDDSATATARAVSTVATEMNLSASDAAAVLSRTAAIGTAEEVVAALQRYVDAGATQLLLRCCLVDDDLLAQSARVMAEVVPLLSGSGRSRVQTRPADDMMSQ
jgi:alkanesulfonate monooxygenase SsuD/methylene tetrahydromethanopterin reductase-like flavin-dependent oxidoreductase (luciferase family)